MQSSKHVLDPTQCLWTHNSLSRFNCRQLSTFLPSHCWLKFSATVATDAGMSSKRRKDLPLFDLYRYRLGTYVRSCRLTLQVSVTALTSGTTQATYLSSMGYHFCGSYVAGWDSVFSTARCAGASMPVSRSPIKPPVSSTHLRRPTQQHVLQLRCLVDVILSVSSYFELIIGLSIRS